MALRFKGMYFSDLSHIEYFNASINVIGLFKPYVRPYFTLLLYVTTGIGNQRVAGSNPGRLGHFGLFLGNIVYPILLQSTQLYNGYLA